jgi:phosphoglycolate phosphatase
MKLVLFDCDGTLVDSADIIHSCMEKTFLEAGYPAPDLLQTKSIIGLTLDVAISRMLQRPVDDQVLHMAVRYKHHNITMRMEQSFHEHFYDGIWDVLEALMAEDEIMLGIVTGKSRRGLNAIIDKHDLDRAIVTSRTADDCPSKPHPAMVLECCGDAGVDPSRTLVIGDAIYDMQMARAAGAGAIGVSWGYSSQAALEEAGAHHVVHHPAALLPLVAGGSTRGRADA